MKINEWLVRKKYKKVVAIIDELKTVQTTDAAYLRFCLHDAIIKFDNYEPSEIESRGITE